MTFIKALSPLVVNISLQGLGNVSQFQPHYFHLCFLFFGHGCGPVCRHTQAVSCSPSTARQDYQNLQYNETCGWMQQPTAARFLCANPTTGWRFNVCFNLNRVLFGRGAALHLLTQHTFRWLSVSVWSVRQTESVSRLFPGGGGGDCARKRLPDSWITHGLGGRVRKAHSFTFLSQNSQTWNQPWVPTEHSLPSWYMTVTV